MTDDETLDPFLREVTPTLEELVTRALQQGRALEHLAVLLERGFDGTIRGGCSSRQEIAAKLSLDARLSDEQRTAVKTAFDAPGDAVPTVLVVHRGEGLLLVGIRRLGGSLVAMS